ncbi:MAG TPA: glutathione S-transferase family protein [Alphaproteobacteria bacterium]|jgi:glutathione S-transferase|nr:glutathione S-transferase family protein [Alphaproteobacteria bacterium]
MKLFLNKTSPYARLALVTAHEAGAADKLETVWVEPWDDPKALLDVNPLGKVPALVTDAGTMLIESGAICDHLIAVSGLDRLMPRQPDRREDTLRRLGLGRATIDCAFGVVIHRRFSGGTDTGLTERWVRAIPRAVAALEELAVGRIGAEPDLGDIAVTVALDYVDFRLSTIAWRTAAPNLARWVDANRERPSFRASDPR